jgi:lipopolysaccharide biosynthesis glycosyltransferase
MTMLYSFVTGNPWFEGDIVVICSKLPEPMVRDLHIFRRIRLLEPSSQLLERLRTFIEIRPEFSDKVARFFSLEIFRLSDYEQVLFLDSDMVVQKSVQELFELPGVFYACPELCWYKGKGRNAGSFLAEYQSAENGELFLKQPVNTGFMLLRRDLLNQNTHEALLGTISSAEWIDSGLSYTDELIINRYFNQTIELLPSRYNYRARAARLIREKEEFTIDDASIIHYYSHFKPWNFLSALNTSGKNATWIRAYEIWYDWYFRFLQFYHLHTMTSGLHPGNTSAK